MTIFGMACFWPLLRRNCIVALSAIGLVPTAQSELVYFLFLTALACCGIGLAAWLRRKNTQGIHSSIRKALVVAAPACLVLFAALRVVPANYVFPFAVLSSLANACCFALVALGWGQVFTRQTDAGIMALDLLPFALSFLVSLPLVFVKGNMGCMVLLILSALSFLLIREETSQTHSELKNSVSRSDLGMAVLAVAFLLVGAFIRGVIGSGVLGSSGGSEQFALQKAAVSMALALLLFAVLRRSKEGAAPTYTIWALLSLAFLAGLFVVADQFANAAQAVGIIAIPARTFFSFLLWAMLARMVRSGSVNACVAYGCVFLPVEAFSWFVSDFGVLFVVDILGIDVFAFMGQLALIAAFLLVAAMLVYVRSAFGGSVSQANAVGAPEAEQLKEPELRERAIELIRREYGLTAREAEVCLYISQGHSYKRMADTMCVSENTTQSHVRSLYRKLGIHSRQEAIDFVDKTMKGHFE